MEGRELDREPNKARLPLERAGKAVEAKSLSIPPVRSRRAAGVLKTSVADIPGAQGSGDSDPGPGLSLTGI